MDQFSFADGSIVSRDELLAQKPVYGIGTAANNSLTGHEGADILQGNAGNDTLYGYAGNDVLEGGVGVDNLQGGNGDDTYRFNLGDGKETIYDSAGTDSVEFTAAVAKESIVLLKTGTTMKIGYGASDEISLSSYADSTTGNRIENITLADGSYLTDADINQIIQDMAAYATTEGISLNSVDDVKQHEPLMTMIADSWHQV